MLSLDGAEHARHREPWLPRFAPRPRCTSGSGPVVARETDRLLDAVADRGRADLRAALAGPLAAAVVGHALELKADPATVLGWYRAIVDSVQAMTAGRRAHRRGPRRVRRAGGRAGHRRRLGRRGDPVRRHRDHRGHDRHGALVPAARAGRRRAGAGRAGLAGGRDRGVAAAGARRRDGGPLRHGGHHARRRRGARRRPRGRIGHRGQPRPGDLPRARPVRPAAREREAPPGVRLRAARVHRRAPGPAGGPHRGAARAGAPARAGAGPRALSGAARDWCSASRLSWR